MSYSNEDMSYKHSLTKAGVVAGVTFGALTFGGSVFDFPSGIGIMGKVYNGPLVAGAAMAGASLVADLAHSYIFPLVFHSQKWEDGVAPYVEAGMMGAAFVGVCSAANSNLVKVAGVPRLILYGAILGAVGSYLTERFVTPTLELAE